MPQVANNPDLVKRYVVTSAPQKTALELFLNRNAVNGQQVYCFGFSIAIDVYDFGSNHQSLWKS